MFFIAVASWRIGVAEFTRWLGWHKGDA